MPTPEVAEASSSISVNIENCSLTSTPASGTQAVEESQAFAAIEPHPAEKGSNTEKGEECSSNIPSDLGSVAAQTAATTDAYRPPEASPQGGVILPADATAELQRRSLEHVLSQVGTTLLSGSIDLSRISTPLHANAPRTTLETFLSDLSSAPYLLSLAASAEPSKRICFVAAFALSCLHKHLPSAGAKPFSARTGDTASVSAQGFRAFAEATAPRGGGAHVHALGNGWTLAGFSDLRAKFAWGLDPSLGTVRRGITVVDFDDGGRVVCGPIWPELRLHGALRGGERRAEYIGALSVLDEQHGLVLDVSLGGESSWWGPREPSDTVKGTLWKIGGEEVCSARFCGAFKKREDAFFGTLTDDCDEESELEEEDQIAFEWDEGRSVQLTAVELRKVRDVENCARNGAPEGAVQLAKITGTYLGWLEVDGERIWDARFTPTVHLEWPRLEDCVQSDCRRREDVQALKKALDCGDDVEERDRLLDVAQGIKERLEEQNREDRRLRREGAIETSSGKSENDEKQQDGDLVGDTLGNSERVAAVDEATFFPDSLKELT